MTSVARGGMQLARVLREQHGAFINAAVEVAEVEGMGSGLVAARRVDAGEPVLAVPKSAWAGLSAQRAHDELQQLEPRLYDGLVAHAAGLEAASGKARALLLGSVALVLLTLRELEAPSSPTLEAHAALLPRQTAVPLFWSDARMAELQASPLVAAVQARRALIHGVYSSVVAVDAAEPVPSSNFAFAWSMLLSRATSALDAQQPLCVVPLLDMLNHAVHVHEGSGHARSGLCRHWYDAASESFVVAPVADVQPGQQLFIRYGDHGNADLLRLYGFTAPDNPSDTLAVGDVVCRKAGNGGPAAKSAEPLLLATRARYATSVEQDVEILRSSDLDEEARHAINVRIGEKQALDAYIRGD